MNPNRSGHILARNTLYTFATQIGIGIIALVSIPTLVTKLGEETFGMLTIVWMIVGYFSVLDLGVGQASVKFLAGQVAKEELHEANSTFWCSLGISIILGLAMLLIFVLLFPFVKSLTNISTNLAVKMDSVFWWIALAIPLIMIQGALRAVPTALQRLDTINIIQGINGLIQWAGALILVYMGGGFEEIVILTVCIRILSIIAIAYADVLLFPALSFPNIKAIIMVLPSLVKYGAWINISQIISPIVKYLDRVMVASYLPLKIFTYYAVPYEAISRLQIVPGSISTSLFPALAEKEILGSDEGTGTRILYFRALNFMLLIMLPVTIILSVFSYDILYYWLGGNFPVLSNSVFKLLAIATCVQALGYIPLTTLQATGRPEIAAKLYIAEIPLYVILCFILVPIWGIEGAAWAFLIRLLMIVSALLWTTHKIMPKRQMVSNGNKVWRSLIFNGILLIIFLVITITISNVIQKVILLVIMLFGYSFIGWFYCIEDIERKTLKRLFIKERTI